MQVFRYSETVRMKSNALEDKLIFCFAVFLNPLYRTSYPEHGHLLDRLEQAIDEQVWKI